jgi:hypothetical protein
MGSPQGWLGLIASSLLCAACAHVPPYERGRLAHPTMDEAQGMTATAEHVHAVHEGATGSSTLSASGCGCN